MSNAGPGLSPNKQAATGKVKPVNGCGCTVEAGYLKGTREVRTTGVFSSPASKAPSVSPGGGGAPGVGGRNKEPKDLMRGKGNFYTRPVNG